jgi:hypothetical protein
MVRYVCELYFAPIVLDRGVIFHCYQVKVLRISMILFLLLTRRHAMDLCKHGLRLRFCMSSIRRYIFTAG